MERWRQVEIEGLESVNHMLEALDIPHKLMDHDWVEVTGTSLHIQADYDNWSNTVTLSIWDTDGNGDSRTIWGMTLPHESMDELLGHLHSALIPMMKRYGDGVKEEEDRTEPLSDGQEDDAVFIRSVFDDLTERLEKACSDCDIRVGIPMTEEDTGYLMRSEDVCHGSTGRMMTLEFQWMMDDSVSFSMRDHGVEIVRDCFWCSVDYIRGLGNGSLWNKVFAMLIKNLDRE